MGAKGGRAFAPFSAVLFFSAWIFSAWIFYAWPGLALAQQALPSNIAYYIDNAARSGSHPNDLIVMAVGNAIAANPQYVEMIMARAVTRAPKERGYLIDMTITSFPHFANRILAGANMAAPRSYASPSAPAFAPSAPAYAPRQTAQAPAPRPRPPAPAPAPIPGSSGAKSSFGLMRKPGGYASFGVAYKMLQDADLENAGMTASGTLGAKKGFVGSIAMGYRFKIGLRGELEGAYHRNIIDQLEGNGFGYTASDRVGGNVTTHVIMANAYYDIPLDVLDGRLTPYIGGGAGYARVKINFDGSAASESTDVVAYQGVLGAEYALKPGIGLKGEYKYFATKDPDFGRTKTEYKSHIMGVGLVFDF